MSTIFNKFEEVLNNKLGEIETKNTYSGHFDTAMAQAVAIWDILGISEEAYNIKYCPVVDISGQEVPTEKSSGECLDNV
jgi:hypothetical protein